MAEANTSFKMRRLEDFDGSETAIVSDSGNLAYITGEVYASSVMPGMFAVETEFGTLYLDADMDYNVAIA